MSPQSASRGPVEQVYVVISPARRCTCPQRTVAGSCHQNSNILGIPSWLMPLRDRSSQRWQPLGKPYVVAATEVCSRFIGTCCELSPPASPSLPFLSLLFGVFLNGRLRITPFFLWCVPGRLFVAGNTCLFLFSPLPFSPFLSFFLSFLSTFLPRWVSLDAFVIAGNPSPLFFWCVLGRLRRSWEHLPSSSFLFLVSPYPSLLSGP